MKKYNDLFVLALILAAVPLLAGSSAYYMRLATLALVYMAWTVAFNLIFGHTKHNRRADRFQRRIGKREDLPQPSKLSTSRNRASISTSVSSCGNAVTAT